ncbi:MAG: hypothetical protein ACEY3J_01745 [Arsenophonus sp.]
MRYILFLVHAMNNLLPCYQHKQQFRSNMDVEKQLAPEYLYLLSLSIYGFENHLPYDQIGANAKA